MSKSQYDTKRYANYSFTCRKTQINCWGIKTFESNIRRKGYGNTAKAQEQSRVLDYSVGNHSIQPVLHPKHTQINYSQENIKAI